MGRAVGEVCGQCGGHWMAGQQLASFIGAPLPKILDDPVHVSVATDSGGRFLELDAGIDCPVCREPLRDYGIRADPELRIAACSRCMGVFLAAEQLERLRKLAPKLAKAKKRDLANPLTAEPGSLRESLAEATAEEKAAVVQATLSQLDKRRRRGIMTPLGCIAIGTIGVTLIVGSLILAAAAWADRWYQINF